MKETRFHLHGHHGHACKRPDTFNRVVKLSIQNRNMLYREWKSCPSDRNWELFRISMNKVHVISKNVKASYYQTYFNNAATGNDFWKKNGKFGYKEK